jgi:hypothetical protein
MRISNSICALLIVSALLTAVVLLPGVACEVAPGIGRSHATKDSL